MSDWVYDYGRNAYYHVASQMYATVDPASGAWQYHRADDLNRPAPPADQPGWGALIDSSDHAEGSNTAAKAAQASSKQSVQPLRLLVSHSTVLDPGHIALIDTSEDGVQVGRDRSESGAPPRLRIKEMEVSKTHAVIFCDSGSWSLVDLGTLINGCRVSEAKSASKPQVLKHMDAIKIGNTTLIAHIHDSWPCQECQLTGHNEIRLDNGVNPQPTARTAASAQNSVSVLYAMDSTERRENREDKRKREMAALRANLLNS